MRDFGNRNEPHSICSVCGSRNHLTEEHRRLDIYAPDLLDALKAVYREATTFNLARAGEVIAKAEGRHD